VSNYTLQDAANIGGRSPQLTIKQFQIIGAHNINITATLATLSNPIPYFHVYAHFDAKWHCGVGVANVSMQAKANGCAFATNGSPFNLMNESKRGPVCQGVLASDGKIIESVYSGANCGFGTLKNGSLGFGCFIQSDFETLNFANFLYGFDWLVYGGVPLHQSDNEVAPRTSIGSTKDGRVMILEIDGIELAKPTQGFTLTELVALWVSLGAHHAYNFDGGGSSTVVAHGRVINKPHCSDHELICERAVSNIICVK
jgi:exopolysaccharide biosynthesis protein